MNPSGRELRTICLMATSRSTYGYTPRQDHGERAAFDLFEKSIAAQLSTYRLDVQSRMAGQKGRLQLNDR